MQNYSFIAVSDIHLGLKLFNLPELAQDLKDAFAGVVELAIKQKVNFLFIAGDLFDVNKPTPDVVQFVKTQVDKLNANGVICAGIAGDHDKPINGASWIQLAGVLPFNFDSRFLGLDYCDDSPQLVNQLGEHKAKDKVEWIFLHGHVPELFKWSEQKKLLDLKQLDLLNTFPNLKGVILGDIHVPTDSVINDPTGVRKNLPYIGYCGSLGIVKTDEIGRKIGVLYFDGKKTSRLPFKLDRQFVKIRLEEELLSPINWITKFTNFYKDNKDKKPVIIVEYDKTTAELLPKLAPLYSVGIVKTVIERNAKEGMTETPKEIVNLRSELKTNDKVEAVLKEMVPEKEVFDITYSLIKNTEEPTIVLDNLKAKYFNES